VDRNTIRDVLTRLSTATTLVPLIEESLTKALPDDAWAWHRCEGRWDGRLLGELRPPGLEPDLRWLFYPKDQRHADRIWSEHRPYWRRIHEERETWPEGFWYALEASLDRRCLLFTHGNHFDGPLTMLRQRCTLLDLEHLVFILVGDPGTLPRLIKEIADGNEPNYFSKT
jgi:hypothetical protein